MLTLLIIICRLYRKNFGLKRNNCGMKRNLEARLSAEESRWFLLGTQRFLGQMGGGLILLLASGERKASSGTRRDP